LLGMSIVWVIGERWLGRAVAGVQTRALIALASGASRAVCTGLQGGLLCSAGEYWTTGDPAIEMQISGAAVLGLQGDQVCLHRLLERLLFGQRSLPYSAVSCAARRAVSRCSVARGRSCGLCRRRRTSPALCQSRLRVAVKYGAAGACEHSEEKHSQRRAAAAPCQCKQVVMLSRHQAREPAL
jgi:hypothetical protein